MGKRNRKWQDPLPGPGQNRGPSMSESDPAPAGGPPVVEWRPRGTPPTVTDISPTTEPPPSPFDRAATLAGLQTAFVRLDDIELQVAQMRILGCTFFDISEELGLLEEEAEKLWKRARKKLGMSLFGSSTPPESQAIPVDEFAAAQDFEGQHIPPARTPNWADNFSDGPDSLAVSATYERFLAAMTTLSPYEREVITLHIQGNSYSAIAIRLGLSVNAVAMRVFRARAKLRQQLELELPEES